MLMHRRPRFTLIELIVVVAILAVLAAILLPTLGQAKRKAEAIYCLNNLKQDGLACHMYADDEEGWFPTTSRRGVEWMVSISGYLGDARTDLDDKVREPKSPARIYPTLECPTYPISQVWGAYYYGSYGYNMHATTMLPTGNPNTEYVRARDNVVRPDASLLIFDNYYVVPDGWGMIAQAARPTLDHKTERFHQRFSLNFVFMDGSAANLRAGDRTDLELGNSTTRNKILRGWTGLE